MDFPQITPSAFYGKRRQERIRDFPSDSEDSKLSDDEDNVETYSVNHFEDPDQNQETENTDDNIPDDVPLAQLFGLPPNTRFFFSNKDEEILWKSSNTVRDPDENIFLGERNLPEEILLMQDPYTLFKIFFAPVCLLLLATHGTASEEYDYSSEDGDYSSEYSDDHSHPDYTKYFGGSAEANAAAVSKENPEGSTGFVNPAEFESFFYTPITFGEPNSKETTAPQTFLPQPAKKADPFEALKQSFTPREAASESNPLKKDYFEESQKKQKVKESEVKPGPHYVSHQIPVPELYEDDEDRAQSKDDVETIPPPLKGKHNKKHFKVNPARDGYDGFKDSFDAFETLRKAEEQIEQTKVDPATLYRGKNADYSTGKSSSTVSQYPAASGYLAKLPTTTLSPYEKYSFQPVTTNYEALQSKYLESLASTPSSLKNIESLNLGGKEKDEVVAPSEHIPENLKNKDCRRIHSPENADNMNCFVCEDALNKAKYTQCSYTSSEEPVNEYAGSSVRYSAPVKAPATFRYKRSPGKYSDDPYYQVSQRNRKYFDDFEKEQQAAESERQKDFHYKPYDPEEYESYSESQSAELLKEPGACQKVDREGMTCTVCKNPKTGGNFEQCSYTSAPKEQKYAYVAEKKYDSDDEPEETKVVTKESSAEPQKTSETAQVAQSTIAPTSKFSTATKSKIVRDPIPELAVAGSSIDETSAESPETEEGDDEDAENDEESDDSEDQKEEKESDDGPGYFNYGELKKDKKLVADDPYDVPDHFAANVKEKKDTEDDGEESFDEYHYKLFPELNKKTESDDDDEQETDATEQKPHDVEEVLAEFAKKDRSNCQKAQKNGMTCFLCVDQNKVQHEECMYIAESRPKPTHIAYHEVQRLKDPKGEHKPLLHVESDSDESKKVESLTQKPLTSEPAKKKRKIKKATTPLPLANLELSGAASDIYRTIVPYEKQKKRYTRKAYKDTKASGSAPDSERLENIRKNKKSSQEPESPKEIDVGDEEGAYSHETRPVYSKLFGTVLPKYMVEKTEFEKDFDAVSGFD